MVKYMMSLKGNPREEAKNYKSNTKKRVTPSKSPKHKNDQESMEMESLQRIIKKLSNEIIDMNQNLGEGTSNTNKFFIFPPKQSTPPTLKNTSPSE